MNKYSTLADIKEEFKMLLHIIENYEYMFSNWKESGFWYKVFNISEGRYLQNMTYSLRIRKIGLEAYFKCYYNRTELESLEDFNENIIKVMKL